MKFIKIVFNLLIFYLFCNYIIKFQKNESNLQIILNEAVDNDPLMKFKILQTLHQQLKNKKLKKVEIYIKSEEIFFNYIVDHYFSYELMEVIELLKKEKKIVNIYIEYIANLEQMMLLSSANNIYINELFNSCILSGYKKKAAFFKNFNKKRNINIFMQRIGRFKNGPLMETRDSFDFYSIKNYEHIFRKKIIFASKVFKKNFNISSSLFYKLIKGEIYNLKDIQKIFNFKFYSSDKIFKNNFSYKKNLSKNQVFVIPLIFPMMNLEVYQEYLNKVFSKIKKEPIILLLIFCPGGSSLIATYIYKKILDLKKNGKIIIAYCGLAASGGYEIACAADYIIASKQSIIGSVGIYYINKDFEFFYKNKGIDIDSIEIQDFKMSDQEIEKKAFEFLLNGYYDFRSIVIKSRKLNYQGFAQGQIWDGSEAKIARLVDSDEGIVGLNKFLSSFFKGQEFQYNFPL